MIKLIILAENAAQGRRFIDEKKLNPQLCIVPTHRDHVRGLRGLRVYFVGSWQRCDSELLQEMAFLVERGRLRPA